MVTFNDLHWWLAAAKKYFDGNPAGTLPVVHKFGRAPDGVQTTLTDIWDRADATPTQSVWTAPTQARVHAIVSSSTSDDGDPAGVGTRTLSVYGLTDWDTAEVSETITMNGTTPVNTANSYVIIHRLRVLTSGATSRNVGTITATAATDGTITAVILPNNGSTQMAIYGVPSVQTLYIECITASVQKSSGAARHVVIQVLCNPEPDSQLTSFGMIEQYGLQSTGSSSVPWTLLPPLPVPGPSIIKIAALASANDLDMTARFSGTLVTN